MKQLIRTTALALILALALGAAGQSVLAFPSREEVEATKRFVAGGYQVTLDEELLDMTGDSAVTVKDLVLLQRFKDGGYGVVLPNADDPRKDDELNLLFIGNSYCYYWTDELYEMLTAAGYKRVTVCNVHAPGGTLAQHWTWHTAGEAKYKFITVDKAGRREAARDMSLDQCLAQKKWDGIELLLGNGPMYNGGEATVRDNVDTYLPLLTAYLKERAPKAKYYWLANWARELEYADTLETKEQQQAIADAFMAIGRDVQEKYGYICAPCAAAWQAVRDDPLITADGRRLTTRIISGDPLYNDYTHDGDVGGGQYLNACIWFEIITRTSCVGNDYRPRYTYQWTNYTLSKAQLALLQNAAHQAVADFHGADWAR